jgi:hypothetical protein
MAFKRRRCGAQERIYASARAGNILRPLRAITSRYGVAVNSRRDLFVADSGYTG